MWVTATIEVFGDTIPDLSPCPDLGVPDPEELVAHFLAEHGGDMGYRAGDDGFLEGKVAFGGLDCVPAWPTEFELAAARDRIGRPLPPH